MKKEKHKVLGPEEQIESASPCGDPCGALYEAYKKHSAELLAIEDRQNKFLLLILTVFGAGATAVTKINLQGRCLAAWYLTFIVVIIGWAGIHIIHETHDLRIAVRDLLVRCELAMKFYKPGIFLIGQPLYQSAERRYPIKGKSLLIIGYLIIGLAGAGLIALVWNNFLNGLP